jgi:hypothetical protein
MDIEEVTSLAQAMQVAQERLAELSKRRQVLDIGIVGNPALQKGDLVSCDDPLVGITVYGRIDTLETDMSADQPYVGVAAVLPQDVVIADDVTEGSDSVDDGSIDENPTPDETDPGADDTPPDLTGQLLHRPDRRRLDRRRLDRQPVEDAREVPLDRDRGLTTSSPAAAARTRAPATGVSPSRPTARPARRGTRSRSRRTRRDADLRR